MCSSENNFWFFSLIFRKGFSQVCCLLPSSKLLEGENTFLQAALTLWIAIDTLVRTHCAFSGSTSFSWVLWAWSQLTFPENLLFCLESHTSQDAPFNIWLAGSWKESTAFPWKGALALSTHAHSNTCGSFFSPLDCRLIHFDVSSAWSASWHTVGLQDVFAGCTND